MVKTGIIYKLVCSDVEIKECYVGSTINFKQRKRQHKTSCNNENVGGYNYYVYQFIRENGGWDTWDMILVEEIEFNGKRELSARERYWVETLNATLNIRVPNRTRKERFQDNEEEYKQKKKQYREDNLERLKLWQNQIIECDCGNTYTKSNYSRHIKTERHQEFETFMKMTETEMLEFIKAI
jgi:hypothetical protein